MALEWRKQVQIIEPFVCSDVVVCSCTIERPISVLKRFVFLRENDQLALGQTDLRTGITTGKVSAWPLLFINRFLIIALLFRRAMAYLKRRLCRVFGPREGGQ